MSVSLAPAPPTAPHLPPARGPVSAAVVHALAHPPGSPLRLPPLTGHDLLADDDAQLALTCCQELSYRGFAGVDDDWESDADLLRARVALEDAFVARIAEEVGPPEPCTPEDALATLHELANGTGPSLSAAMLADGTHAQLREFCIHRSAYQLKEADPHTWLIPRLSGSAKRAVVHVQLDEYGRGVPGEAHAELFAVTMRALGLDDHYGAYLDALPAPTLATGNLVSLFGLRRRFRGAGIGHLALFETTSVAPMGRYAATLARLGVDPSAARFYDVHVIADEDHGRVAIEEMVPGFLAAEPGQAGMVRFGARALDLVESRFSGMLRTAWARGGHALLGLSPSQLPVRAA